MTALIRRGSTVLAITVAAGLASCSSAESTPTEAPSSAASISAATGTASPSTSPSEAAALEADHILGVSIDGYAFVELPRSIERQARRQFEASAGLDPDEARLDLRSLTSNGDPHALVLVVTLSPEYAALPGTEEGFVNGMAGSAGTKPEEAELGTLEGFAVDNGEQQIVAWQDSNLLVAVFAERRADAMDAARAIVEATG